MMQATFFLEYSWLDWLSRLAMLFMSVAAGFVVFTVVLNPRFVRIPKRRYRKVITISGLILTIAGFGFYGLFTRVSFFTVVLPLGILVSTSLVQRTYAWRHQVQKRQEPRTDGRGISLLRPFTTTDLVTRHYQVRLDNWKGPAFKLVHVSDFHVSKLLPMDYFVKVVQQVRTEKPDLILVTGDFITFADDVALLSTALAGLEAPSGVYGILGNHDQFKAAGEVILAANRLGIEMIGGRKVHVPGLPGLVLAGDEYPWGSKAPNGDLPDRNDTLFVLTHTPDNIYRFASSQLPPAAVFAGHLHGGQIRLPYAGAVIVPSNYGKQFSHGHFLVRKTHLFVTAGVGAAAPPVRIWCQPEILVINIGA